MYKNSGKKIIVTIEARMTSSRLPGKVVMPLAGKPDLERLIERVKRSRYVDDVVVATTINNDDDVIVALAERLGVKYFRGSEYDVLQRVLFAARSVNGDIIVEITGDCPLVDWRLIDRGIEEFFESGADYAANNLEPLTFPNGFDVQVFPVAVLAEADRLTRDPIDHVQVTPYIYNHPERFTVHRWEAAADTYGPELRVTLDEIKDYELLDIIFKRLLPENEDFSAADVVALLRKNPELVAINKNVRQKHVSEG